jgi:hypothetical protein
MFEGLNGSEFVNSGIHILGCVFSVSQKNVVPLLGVPKIIKFVEFTIIIFIVGFNSLNILL